MRVLLLLLLLVVVVVVMVNGGAGCVLMLVVVEVVVFVVDVLYLTQQTAIDESKRVRLFGPSVSGSISKVVKTIYGLLLCSSF